jgi:uncharacterized surface anchored protein
MKKRTMKRLLGAIMSFSLLLQPMVSSANQYGYGNVASARDNGVEVTTEEDAAGKVTSSSDVVTVNNKEDKKTEATLPGANRANDSPNITIDNEGNINSKEVKPESEKLTDEAKKSKVKTPDDVDFNDAESIKAALANKEFPFKPDSEWGAFLETQGVNAVYWENIDRDGGKWYRDYYYLRLNELSELYGTPEYEGGTYKTKITMIYPRTNAYAKAIYFSTHKNRMGETVTGGYRPGTELAWITVGGDIVFCIQPHKILNSNTTVIGHQDVGTLIGQEAQQTIARIIYVAQGHKVAGVKVGQISPVRYLATQLLIWGYMREGAQLGDNLPDLGVQEWSNITNANLRAEMDDIVKGVKELEANSKKVFNTETKTYDVKAGDTVTVPLNNTNGLKVQNAGIVESATVEGTNLKIKIKSDAGANSTGKVRVVTDNEKYSILERYVPKNPVIQQTVWLYEFGDPQEDTLNFRVQPNPNSSINFIKTDKETGQPVPYAKFNVTGPEGFNKDIEVVDGKFTLSDVKPGEYTAREIAAHDGYVLDGSEVKFTVKDGVPANVEVKNTKIKGNLKLFKRDSVSKAGIKGVKFKLEGTSKVGEDTKVKIERTTDDEGDITFDDLTVGTYTLTEETPQGYVANNKAYTVKVTKADATATEATVKVFDGDKEVKMNDGVITIDNTPFRGNIKIIKKGSANWLKNLYDAFLLEGAEFGVYDADGKELAKAKTNAQGVVEFNDLPGGTYTIKETFVPEGYVKVEDFNVTISEPGKTVTVEKIDEVRKGKLRVVKVDKENNKPVNFAGAQFKIKNLQTNQFVTEEGKEVFETNAQGEFTTKLDLLYGQYELHEVKAPEGYLLDTTPIKFTVSGDNTVVAVNFADVRVKGQVTVDKTGAVATDVTTAEGTYGTEYSVTMGQDKALEGVQFDVIAKEDITLKTGDVVKRAGEKVGTITTDSNGKGTLAGLEIGKYTLKETKAPAGYVLAADKDFEIKYEGETKAVVTRDAKVENAYRQVKLVLDKDEEKQVGLDTTKDKAHGTPKYDLVAGADKVFVVKAKDAVRGAKGQELIPAGGIVATLTTDANGHVDKTISLPDGTYTVQEVKTTAGLVLDEAVREFTVSSTDNSAVKEVNLSKVTINKDKFTNKLKPIKLQTTATNKEDGSKVVSPVEKSTIVDRVEYKNLIVDGRSYTVSGKLMVKETGQPLLDNGKEVTATKTFVPTTTDGSVDLEFTFNASALGGNKVVAFEDLHQDKIHVGTHSDLNDEGQTVEIPKFELKTTATNKADGSKVFDANSEVKLNDRVEYKGATVGKEYTVKGTLVNTKGEPIVQDGKPVTAETTFTAEKEDGFVDVVFTFNAKDLKGQDVVVFEKAYQGVGVNAKLIGKHEDPKDEGQTVKVLKPEIETMASFNGRKVEDHLGDVTLRDVVKATNVVVGRSYELTADLKDAATEEAIKGKDGNAVQTKVQFTVGAEGTFIVKDVPKLEKGQMFVIRDGKLLIVDEEGNQVSEVPVVNASELKEGTPVTMFTHADLKYDASALENVLKSEEKLTYEAPVVDNKDGKAKDEVAAKEDVKKDEVKKDEVKKDGTVVAKDEPKANIHVDKNGNVDVTGGNKAILDDLLRGVFNPTDEELTALAKEYKAKSLKTVVVYETLTKDGDELAFHRDPKDTDQQGHHNNVKLRTTFMDVKTGSHFVEVGGTAELVDRVALYNVINGNEYEVTGTIHDRATGKPVTKEDGTPYTNTVKVTVNVEGAKKGAVVNTTVDVPFTVNMADIKTTHIVAFEEIKRSGGVDVLAVHKDVNDKYQTIEVKKPEVKTKFADVKGSQEILPVNKVEVIDHVDLKGVINGNKYEVTGMIMDKATGKPLEDANGVITSKVTVEVKDDTKPKGAYVDTKAEVKFTIDASALAGKEIVAFEELRKAGDTEVIANHKDINDKDQTIKVAKPELKTKATIGGKKEATIGGEITIEDTISYKGLKPGVEYTFKGKLMNAKTKQPVKGTDGKDIVAETKVKPDKADGVATVTFKFNSKGMDTTKIVVFEEAFVVNDLTKEPNKVGSHEDFTDTDQTVGIVKKGERLPNTSISDYFTDYSGYALGGLVLAGLGLVGLQRKRRNR